MDLEELQRTWNAFGRKDPLWAICVQPDKKGNRWRVDEFFKTGERDIEEIMAYVASLGITLPRGRALDFGCGVGRLTQALAHHFDEVYGVDIAPSMIELAKEYNRHGRRCLYFLNETADLQMFDDDTFDFVFSIFTLQHVRPQYALNYIKEFVRVTRPRGLIIFQEPSERTTVPRQGRIAKVYRRVKQYYDEKIKGYKPLVMEMHGIKREDVTLFLKRCGAVVVDVVDDGRAGPEWVSYQYCVLKI